jgi:hypothetical protein
MSQPTKALGRTLRFEHLNNTGVKDLVQESCAEYRDVQLHLPPLEISTYMKMSKKR